MASKETSGSLRPRSRRSIAHVPRSKMASGVDKENATTDLGAARNAAKELGKERKSRSKSLGPGGLDALQDSHGNRRKSTMALPLKSILKPTIPVSPVRSIPTFEETRRRSPRRGIASESTTAGDEGDSEQNKEGPLIDVQDAKEFLTTSHDDQTNPFDTFNASSAIRDAKEREEKEKRERERKMILEKREARRKSMANRRVSFAPEATLHTWNVVEIPDDSTSSSASNSTRRASSLTHTEASNPAHPASILEPPSSPDAEVDSDSAFSPVRQEDLRQLQDRNSSAQNPDLSSSPFSGSSADGSEDTEVQGFSKDDDEDDHSDGSDSGLDGESTAMSMDDVTMRSTATAQSEESTSSSARLNEALRQAAREAGTRGIDYDENDDVSMEIADQEITGAFQPWIKKGERKSFDWEDISSMHDQENINPSRLSTQDRSYHTSTTGDNDDEDMSMDVTNAIGGILSNNTERRQSVMRRKSLSEETIHEDQTMEFTNVVGGIAPPISPAHSMAIDSDTNEDEEMTMEFTSVVGGLLGKSSAGANNNLQRGQSASEINGDLDFDNEGQEETDDVDMEITRAVGGILPSTQEEEDQTMGMEVTAAIGRILPSAFGAGDKAQAKKLMELETDAGQLASSPFQESVQHSPSKLLAKSPTRSPVKSPLSFHVATVASEDGSPSLASVRSRPSRRSSLRRSSSTPTSNPSQTSPAKKSSTPPKQTTPQLQRPTTPSKTPPSSNVSFRSASPKKLFQAELQKSASKQKSPRRKSLFEHNAATGQSTPLVVLRPAERRSSGLGIDREGLGSPRVAAMLDKRKSIGEEASQFVPQEKPFQGVRFEDPIQLQEEVDREREEEEKREDGHIQPPKRDITSTLKDMISSLTPKKNKLRGRKSLHVGAARGLLGKRPVELDQDEEEEAESTPKRLRGPESSPVKSIRLPAPPTKEETVGRVIRSSTHKPFGSSPAKQSTTPTFGLKNLSINSSSPIKDVSDAHEGPVDAAVESLPEQDETGPEGSDTMEPIQLQEFLNMTNIHFMELTTTKRRHTTAPGSTRRSLRLSGDAARFAIANFEDCVAAGFCTVPMLELYQHSCRELKSYISEGRQVIRSIEAETYAENPPLFREYVTAAPDIRLLMDNQFRNVKTHARLLSKATWYEWRMKLLEGLKEGLDRHVEEMKTDDEYLSKHEELLKDVVPELIEKHASLEQEASTLQQLADEIENCDQDELRSAREKLLSVEAEIVLKKRQLAEMQEEIQDKVDTIEAGAELKAEALGQIERAEKVKEECRGWSAKEINGLKVSVHNLEHQTGWCIVAASTSSSKESSLGPSLTMRYRDQLELTLHPKAFQATDPGTKLNAPLELKYTTGSGSMSTKSIGQLSLVSSLVLRSLQRHLATVDQTATQARHVLRCISQAWDQVATLEEEARMLEFCGVTKLKLLDASESPSLRARCSVLGAKPNKQRIDIDFAVTMCIKEQRGGEHAIAVLEVKTDVIASKVYGFGTGNEVGLSEKEMQQILRQGLGAANKAGRRFGNGVWSNSVKMLTAKAF
ncbi:hypothetical protein ASPZODRAFT_131824 [Penicilliopsis zonata CBS 506.65]|uniref:Spc7 kinetochore protein domain-containing protein n=1 Tax=Penicilliopsis zonata CBS 506.65 TaxID=1073090 RepID=A0A1L9SI78_9EURO|nr:hypothetical protein ASPZODRAFT_131824 [Penicilliopsis zonata CBS 506.65]OJJ46915.1 hypothetical protein ASPZODRAFT_131824 [Penicilliopsis zonata CBS 506.65]